MIRDLAALAAYSLLAGICFFLLFLVCGRCGQDNAYIPEYFLGVILVLIGLVSGAIWFVRGRAGGSRGLAVGAVAGIVVGAVIIALGASRAIIPPTLTVIELVLLIVGAFATGLPARRTAT